jgi:hypothetical protein
MKVRPSFTLPHTVTPYVQAHIRKIDALYALKLTPQAAAALKEAVALHPRFTETSEYKV